MKFGLEGWISIGGRGIPSRAKNIRKTTKDTSVGSSRRIALAEQNAGTRSKGK